MWGPGVLWAVLRHPRLWGEAVRTLVAMSPRAWWKKWPPVPVPDAAYMSWRTATAYGSPDAAVSASDVIDYLTWRKRFRVKAGL